MNKERYIFLSKSFCDNIERIADALESMNKAQYSQNELLGEIGKFLNNISLEI